MIRWDEKTDHRVALTASPENVKGLKRKGYLEVKKYREEKKKK